MTRSTAPAAPAISGTPRSSSGKVIAACFPMTDAQKAYADTSFGHDWIGIDLREAPASVDVVIVHPCSPQCIAGLRRDFPKARVVVVQDLAA